MRAIAAQILKRWKLAGFEAVLVAVEQFFDAFAIVHPSTPSQVPRLTSTKNRREGGPLSGDAIYLPKSLFRSAGAG